MMAEDKVFARKRFDRSKMEEYGFAGRDGSYVVVREFMGGDFTAELTVGRDGKISGRVIDRMNDEEYIPLRNPNYNGSYVNTVRAAYDELLRDIAACCCVDVVFSSDQSNRIAARIFSEFGVTPDFPWDDDPYSAAGVFRHRDTRKWFGLIMNIRKGRLEKDVDETPVDVLNLKIEPDKAETLHREAGIYPAWHMNHKTWISVILDDTLRDERVMELAAESYRLTDKKKSGFDDKLIREVLAVADSIPYGKVATYGQIAGLVGREKNARMIGKIMSMADRYGEHPCHRVVNHAGRTVPGWEEQRGLLEAEGISFKDNGCVDMAVFQWDATIS